MIKKMTAKSIRKIIYLFVAAIVCALTTITAFCNKCEVNAASEAGYLYYTSDFSGGYSYFDSSYEWWKHIVDGLSLRFVSDYVVPASCEVTNNINIDLNGITLKQNSIKLNANINVYDYKGGGKGLFTIGKNSSVSFVGSANSLVDANVDENANFRVESGRIVFLYFLNDHAYINSVLPEKCCFVAHYATGKDELYPYESGKVPLFNGTTSSSDITYLSVEKCHHKMIKNNVCVYCNTTIDSTEALRMAQAELEEAKAGLVEKIETKAGKDELTQAISDLNAAIDTAKTTSNTYADTQDTALKEELTQTIETAKTEAVNAAKTLVDEAKAELVEKIETKAGKDELTQAISDLNAAIDTAKTTSNAYADAQDEQLKTELIQSIETAKTEAMSAAKTLIDDAKAELVEKIETKASKEELTQAISDLNAAIDTAKTTSNTYADTQDTALKQELEQAIETAKNAAIDSAKTLVGDAKAELQELIDTKADKTALTQAITDLNAAIDTAKTTSNTYADTQDEQLKTELIQSIETAKTEAMSAAKTLIDDAKAELVEKIETKASKDELTQAISDLNAAIDTAKTTSNTYADTQDEELKTELEQKILEAKTALQGAINSISERLEQIETKNNKNSEEIKSLKIATYISLGVVFVLSMAMVVMIAVLKHGIRNGVKKNKSN